MFCLAVVKCFNKRLSLLFPSDRQLFYINLPLLLQCSLIFKAVNLTGLYRKAFLFGLFRSSNQVVPNFSL